MVNSFGVTLTQQRVSRETMALLVLHAALTLCYANVSFNSEESKMSRVVILSPVRCRRRFSAV